MGAIPGEWILALGIVGIIVLIIIIILIGIVINTIFLKIGLALFESTNNEFGAVFVTALIMALIGWIPCIGWILCWVVINSRHDTGFWQAIVIWLISSLISFIVGYFVGMFILPLII
ncbi:MAG: hypothetical protein ACTSU4_01835 [Promethearchaeota archaeon]